MIQKIAILACGLLLVGARPGSAQILQWQDRGFLNVNLGGQGKSNDFTTSLSRSDLYEETATVETSQSHKGGAFFDLSGGYRVWNNIAVGMSFARRSADADGDYTASVPDPVSSISRASSPDRFPACSAAKRSLGSPSPTSFQ